MTEQLFPVIQASGWEGAAHSAHRPLFIGDDESPLIVTFAKVTPEGNQYLRKKDLDAQDKSIREIEAEAIARWVDLNRELNWEEVTLPTSNYKGVGVYNSDSLISSMLLSGGHLKGMHGSFDVEVLSIAVPDRHTILAHQNHIALGRVARKLYEEAIPKGTQISPLIYLSRGDEIGGYTDGIEREEELPVDLVSNAGIVVCAVHYLVSDAAGKLDPKHLVTFKGHLTDIGNSGDTLTHKACRQLLENDLAPIKMIEEEGLSPTSVAGRVQRRVEDFEYAAGKHEGGILRDISKWFAGKISSGPGLFGAPKDLSQEHHLALILIKGLLR